jgi:hypothetical protein
VGVPWDIKNYFWSFSTEKSCGKIYICYRHFPTYVVVTIRKFRLKSELRLHTVNYTCITKVVQLKSKLLHFGTCSAAAFPPHRMHYRSTVFFLNFYLIALSFPRVNIRWDCQKYYFFYFPPFISGCSTLKLRDSGNVCIFSMKTDSLKRKQSGNTCTSSTLSTACTSLNFNPCLLDEKPATICLHFGRWR